MSDWIDFLHVLSEIALILIIIRLQYKLFFVTRKIHDLFKLVDDLKRTGILNSKSCSGIKRGNDAETEEKARE